MDTVWIVMIVVVGQALICGGLASNLAEKKGHSAGAWFAAGFFFGVLGLISAAGLPTASLSSPGNKLLKKCPSCAERIRREALICKFCGTEFERSQVITNLVKLVESVRMRDSDDNGPIRLLEETLESLIAFTDRSIAPQLAAIAQKTESSTKAGLLCLALGSLGDPSSIPVLIEFLQRDEATDEVECALKMFGEAAIPPLEQLAEEGKRRDRKLAKRIISEIWGTDDKE